MDYSRLLGGAILIGVLAGCASDKHLLFFTNSSLGIDISVEQSQNPVKFIVGYKRQEGVLDPLAERVQDLEKAEGAEALNQGLATPMQGPPGKPYPQVIKTHAHSVLAKMNFGATGGGSTNGSAAQWFATGRAAELLAENPLTPAAISGEPQIVTSKGLNLGTGNQVREMTILGIAYKQLDDYVKGSGSDDKDAVAAKAAVDVMDAGEFRAEFEQYSLNKDKKLVIKNYLEKSTGRVAQNCFGNVVHYLEVLQNSVDVGKYVTTSTLKEDGAAVSTDEQKRIIDTVMRQNERLLLLRQQIAKDKNVINMLNVSIFRSI